MAYSCPDCASELSVADDHGSRTLVCPSCQGRLVGLSPFEHALEEGVGARVWVGAAGGPPAGPCPYCTQPMRQPAADADAGPGLAVCRTCQEIWVPAGAGAWMAAHAAPGQTSPLSARPAPTECANCGAPYQPDEEGHCRFCHAQIAAPQPMVMIMQETAPASDWGNFRLW